MQVTTPKQMATDTSRVEKAIKSFEKEFSKEKRDDEEYHHLIIIGEYDRQTCDEVERIYTEAGWSKVKCTTSSENGERGGLTGLQLYRP
jgi:hypothetical protein